MKRFKVLSVFLSVVFLLTLSASALAAVAKITELSGAVKIMPEGGSWQTAKLNQELNEGDKIMTAEKSRAVIVFYSGHSAVVGPDSSMAVKEANSSSTGLDLFKGKLRSKVKKLSPGQAYKIETPQAVCAVRGTDFEVNVGGEKTKVRVFEGVVEAKEIFTGEKVTVAAGQYSEVRQNEKPSEPKEDPEQEKTEKEEPAGEEKTEDDKPDLKEEARKEMFEEISRDAVLSRAAEEIKKAEYENGKALLDAHGNRVRLEEYIVRPAEDQFKYVVLNHRENRFDFGKILFKFDSALPDDLSLATRSMFKSKDRPEWILTDLVSVMSNTKDQINEEASGGDMIQDLSGDWRHYFANYEFSVKGYEKPQKTLWTQTVTDTGGTYEDLSARITYGDAGSLITEKYSRPEGEDVFHLKIYNKYADGTWLAAEDYLINDDGEIQSSDDLKNNFSSELGGSFKDYLAKLNFERKYTSSEFGDRDIDLVLSTKLLLDSGMLSMSLEE